MQSVLLGWSHHGRPITAVHVQRPGSRILVVGCIHGTECAGVAIVRELRAQSRAAMADVWLLRNLNPDGRAGAHRQNGRGVDLNRNFPSQWRPIGVRWDPEYAGPRPLSERETRIAVNLIERIRPETTIWYHQYHGTKEFVRAWGESVAAGRRYARLAGIPFRRMPWPSGTAPNWQNHRFRGTSSFVVEFPPGPLPRALSGTPLRSSVFRLRGTEVRTGDLAPCQLPLEAATSALYSTSGCCTTTPLVAAAEALFGGCESA